MVDEDKKKKDKKLQPVPTTDVPVDVDPQSLVGSEIDAARANLMNAVASRMARRVDDVAELNKARSMPGYEWNNPNGLFYDRPKLTPMGRLVSEGNSAMNQYGTMGLVQDVDPNALIEANKAADERRVPRQQIGRELDRSLGPGYVPPPSFDNGDPYGPVVLPDGRRGLARNTYDPRGGHHLIGELVGEASHPDVTGGMIGNEDSRNYDPRGYEEPARPNKDPVVTPDDLVEPPTELPTEPRPTKRSGAATAGQGFIDTVSRGAAGIMEPTINFLLGMIMGEDSPEVDLMDTEEIRAGERFRFSRPSQRGKVRKVEEVR